MTPYPSTTPTPSIPAPLPPPPPFLCLCGRQVEEEISTLRQVLSAKEKHAAELKRKLGLNPLNELKQNITKGWQDVQASNAYVAHRTVLFGAGLMQSTPRILRSAGVP